MGRLFWKIFLAFWVAMLLIAAGAAIATTYGARGLQDRAFERRARLDSLAAEAADALAVDGVDGLKRWLRAAVESEGDYLYVVDGEGELLGRPLPPRAGRPGPPPGPSRGWGERGQKRKGPLNRLPPDRRPPRDKGGLRHGPPPGLAGDSIDVRTIPGGEGRYRLLADLGLRPLDLLRSPLVAAVWIGLAVVISGGVCFLLARYLVAPVQKMSRATRRFTAGELDARVGAPRGGRRDEIVDLGRDIDTMAEHIGKMLTSQRRLLRDLSHELRSPLARLQVALELARKRAEDKAGSELERIELEAERLNDLIGEILALARLESSPHTLERSRIDLAELVGGVVDDAAFEAESSGKRVRFDAGERLEFDGHDELLRRAIENVVRNAVRHTGAGTAVDVSLIRSGAEVVVRVHDQGPGVPRSSLPQMFEPFFRDPEARADHPVGHGIGLAIAKRAIEVHGGRVTAGNHPDGGLVVELALPLSG